MGKSAKTPLSRVRVVNGSNRPMLYIGKARIKTLTDGGNLTDRHISLIDQFLRDVGRVVSYERLAKTMRLTGTGPQFKQSSRQYVYQIRLVFEKAKVDAHFAVVGGVGYALCEPARS